MGTKRRKKSSDLSPGQAVAAEFGLDPAVWDVGVGYSKGILSGSRGAHVTVTHLPTGRTKSAYVPSRGKAAARRDAAAAVRRFVQQLQSD